MIASLRILATHYDAPRLFVRAFVLWALLRVLVSVAVAWMELGSAGAGVIMLALVPALCHVDARVMREELFYANLGRPSWAPAVAGALLAIGMEMLLAMLVAL